MADTKISALTAIPSLASADLLPIVDDSEVSTAIKQKKQQHRRLHLMYHQI